MSDLAEEAPPTDSPRSTSARLLGLGIGLLSLGVTLIVLGQAAAALVVVIVLPFLVALAYLASPWVTPAALTSLTVAATSFSGHWPLLGSPLPLDRMLFVFTLVLIGVDIYLRRNTRVVHWRPIHVVLALLLAYAAVSAFAVGTLTTSNGLFALLDRLGVVPMLALVGAGLIFPDRHSRNVLLVVLVGLGAYLAVTAILEGFGLGAYTWPSYINNPAVGIQYGRARGPFVESVAMGLALFECAVAAAIAAWVWKPRAVKLFAVVVAVACLFGTVFTLTRAVWIGSLLGAAAVFFVVPALRKWLLPAAVIGTVVVASVLLVLPGFSHTAGKRVASERPVWDRLNTNRAALAMVEQHPLFGIGWNRFVAESDTYLRQGVDYPLTGAGIEVHNVLLSHAAELGLIGAALWLVAVGGSIGRAMLQRAPPDLVPWRLGLIAVGIQFGVIATFGPLSYALPNILVWLWAGLVLRDYLTDPVGRPGEQ